MSNRFLEMDALLRTVRDSTGLVRPLVADSSTANGLPTSPADAAPSNGTTTMPSRAPSESGLALIREVEARSGISDPSTVAAKIDEARRAVDASVKVDLNQHQYDALLCFVVGISPPAFVASTLLRVLNAGGQASVAPEMRKWVRTRQGDQVVDVPQLAERRAVEAQLFELPPSSAAIAQSLSAYVAAFGAVNVSVSPSVTPLRQDSPRTCWAAVMTMMISWRRGQSIASRDALAAVGDRFLRLYEDGSVLPPDTAPELYRAAGLETIVSFNPTIEGWASLLSSSGPLYVDVGSGESTVTHAFIVTGISGDGTPNGTSMTYIDPSDGSTQTVPFMTFLSRYEAPGAVKTWPYTIVHWPSPAKSQSFDVQYTFAYRNPSGFVRDEPYAHQSQVAEAITIGEAIQIGLGAAAIVQTAVAGSHGTFALSYDKAQRLLTNEARQQMPGAQAAKRSYRQQLFHFGISRPGTAKANVIIEWDGNPYGEIGTPVVRIDLPSSTEWAHSDAKLAVTSISRIPIVGTDPRAWPLVYAYEGSYDPVANGKFEFSGQFEVNAFGGLKFVRHTVVSHSLADFFLSDPPEAYVVKGNDVIVPTPPLSPEQHAYLRSHLP